MASRRRPRSPRRERGKRLKDPSTSWNPDDDTEAQIAQSRRSVLRDETREVRRQAGDRPVYYTERCTSSNPRDPMHDEPYAAALIVKTILEANGLVQGYSYWTFSDILEENYFLSVPFHGGFGLFNIHGIAKAAYRAFELLHALGAEILPVEGAHPTFDAWAVRDAHAATCLLINYALPRHSIATETVRINLGNAQAPNRAKIRRIDMDHANPKRRWLEMGSPDYLNAAVMAELDAVSRCESEPHPIEFRNGVLGLDVTLPPLSVASVTFEFSEGGRG
jgi:xylan 1,4-beta-xylosidase